MSKLMVTERLTLRQLEFNHDEALGRDWCSSTGRVKIKSTFDKSANRKKEQLVQKNPEKR